MKDLLENLKKRLADEETTRFLKFMVIPLIVIILIIVIVVADKPQEDEGKEQTAVSQYETGTVEETKEKTAEEETAYHLEEAGDEIRSLMEAYFKARRTCDINGLADVYGDSASPEELREEGLRMEEEVKYYQSYHDLICYTVSGPAEDSLVVYTRFNIKFRQSDTMAPSMFACFVKRGEDGNWHMVAEVTAEEQSYMEAVNESKAIQDMAEEVNGSLRAALESDSNLLAVYNTLMAGQAVPEGGAEADTGAGEGIAGEAGTGEGTAGEAKTGEGTDNMNTEAGAE